MEELLSHTFKARWHDWPTSVPEPSADTLLLGARFSKSSASHRKPRNFHLMPSVTSARITASIFRPNCRTNRPLMPRPSVILSSNRGKKSRNIKIIPDCRTKSDSALPQCSTFALSITPRAISRRSASDKLDGHER